MKYICTKRAKITTLNGERNIPRGEKLESHDGFIYDSKGRAICADHSQNAYDYFSNNDDGHGFRRGDLVREIMKRLNVRDDDYQKRWDRIWDDESLKKYKRTDHGDFWLWNFDFFNAPILVLEYILAKVKG